MRLRIKIPLTILIIAVIVNLPIMPYTDASCNRSYESYMTYQFPCGFGCESFGSNVKTVTLPNAILYGGYSATSSSVATSKLLFALNSPQCTPTFINSVILVGSNLTTITTWDNNSSPSSTVNLINFSSGYPGNNVLAPANITPFTFYPDSFSREHIISGNEYNYVINLANGQSVSGSLTAE